MPELEAADRASRGKTGRQSLKCALCALDGRKADLSVYKLFFQRSTQALCFLVATYKADLARRGLEARLSRLAGLRCGKCLVGKE